MNFLTDFVWCGLLINSKTLKIKYNVDYSKSSFRHAPYEETEENQNEEACSRGSPALEVVKQIDKMDVSEHLVVNERYLFNTD